MKRVGLFFFFFLPGFGTIRDQDWLTGFESLTSLHRNHVIMAPTHCCAFTIGATHVVACASGFARFNLERAKNPIRKFGPFLLIMIRKAKAQNRGRSGEKSEKCSAVFGPCRASRGKRKETIRKTARAHLYSALATS